MGFVGDMMKKREEGQPKKKAVAKAEIEEAAQVEIEEKAAKVSVTIRLDPRVVVFFKSKGMGWQTRINDLLLAHVRKQGGEK